MPFELFGACPLAAFPNDHNSVFPMPLSQLSAKAISELLRGEKPNQPILQLIEAKPIKQQDNSAPSKFKGLISDSTHQTGAIFTSALSSQLIDGTLRVNAIIRLRKYLVQKLGQNKMVVIMGVDVVEQLEVRDSRDIFFYFQSNDFCLAASWKLYDPCC